MTQPANTGSQVVIHLPKLEPPVTTLVITNRLIPEEQQEGQPPPKNSPIMWVLGERHPMRPGAKIVRMFSDENGGIEVYATLSGGTEAVRHRIPAHLIRFVEESMPIDMLAEEIAAMQDGSDDGDDDDDDNAPESAEGETAGGAKATPNGTAQA